MHVTRNESVKQRCIDPFISVIKVLRARARAGKSYSGRDNIPLL